MKQVQIARIKAAGSNITIIGTLLLVSSILPVVAVLHFENIDATDLQQKEKLYWLYGISYLILSIAIMINVFLAGNNLSSCDIEEALTVERQIVYRVTTENKTLRIISTNHETIGAEVYIENNIAPDGEYQYKDDNRKLIVKDGKIERMLS